MDSIEKIIAMDVNKYITWLFKHTPTTRKEKKEHVLSGIQFEGERNIANFRKWIDIVFYKTKYWEGFTEQKKDNFPFWRENSFKYEQDFFNFRSEGSPLPVEVLKEYEYQRIIEKLNSERFAQTINDLINAWLTKDIYTLAEVCGIIDHAKSIYYQIIELDSTDDSTFEFYLTEKGKFIYPFLLNEFTGEKGVGMVCMIYALKKFNYVDSDIFETIKKDMAGFQKCLNASFGNTGSSSGFRDKVNDLRPHQHKKITEIQRKIASYIHDNEII